MKTQPQSTNYRLKSNKKYLNRLSAKTQGTKQSYYVADTGHFGIPIKVCFSDASFQQAVRDSRITTRHNALDVGLAESHFIEQEGTQNAMLAIVFLLRWKSRPTTSRNAVIHNLHIADEWRSKTDSSEKAEGTPNTPPQGMPHSARQP